MAELQVTRQIAATPEHAFDAWLDPAIARRFLFATPDGEMVRADIDARVAGRFTFVDRRPNDAPHGGDILHTGEYLVIERPRRLVFTFAVPQFEPAYTRVDLAFEAKDGGCLITLTHTEVAPDWLEGTREGWATILAKLDEVLL